MKSIYLIKLLLFVLLSFGTYQTFGQDSKTTDKVKTVAQISDGNGPVEMEKSEVPTTNILYQNKRINLVVFVLAIIFVGIILYLVRIERALSKAEKNKNESTL